MARLINRKSNEHKKMTFEDRFDRKYACWVTNVPKAWRYWKVRNRRLYRRMKDNGKTD